MVRTFSLLAVLAALAVAGYLHVRQTSEVKHEAPTAVLQAASTALELNHRVSGSYAGVRLDGATLVRADASSYCVEALESHLAGPGGTPQPGPC